MRERCTHIVNQMLRVVIITAAFILVSAIPLYAQQNSPVTPPSGVNSDRVLSPDQRVRALEIESERKHDPKDVMAQVNEDFMRLRALDEEMSKALTSKSALDYKSISETTTEIKKRSTRLKTNLTLPEGKKDDKRQAIKDPADGQLTPALASLDVLIQSFTQNPIFSDTGAIDPQLAARARRDLEDIISLSDKIRKSAEKMNKSTAKSQ